MKYCLVSLWFYLCFGIMNALNHLTYEMPNSNATKFAKCVGDVTGHANVAETWKTYFANLYNSVNNNGSK